MEDEFRMFEDNMYRMFEKILNIPVNRSLLLAGGRTTIGSIEKYKKPFIDLVETDKEVIATVEMPGLDKGDIKINLTEQAVPNPTSMNPKHSKYQQKNEFIL